MAKGSARLNVQGLARRDKLLMGCIRPAEGHDCVSIDLSAGEPTVCTHFSKDPVYRYCTFDGIGKAPFYRNGYLWIDDIYLTTASINPLHAAAVKDAFENGVYEAGTFAQQWLKDPEVIKTALKAIRQFNKMAQLGFSYGMGPKKFVKQARDAGYTIPLADAQTLYKAYWKLFAGVKSFIDRCSKQVERDTYLVNPFGYRLKCDPHKAFNAYIQSSVSGIMHVFLKFLAEEAPYMILLTVIHDEIVAECPIDRVEEFRQAKERAEDRLNDALKWNVKVRTGFVTGKNWFEAK